MIIIHVYCSYKSSPIGFAYGSYEYSSTEDALFYYLNNNHNNSFVLSSFEDGKIRHACGKLPDSVRYIFLIRKLKHDYGAEHKDFGRDVDMNFAFEFDDFIEFKAFTTGFSNAEKQDPKQLYKELADCIVPDISIEIYKLSINKNVFDSWFNKMLKTEPSEKHTNLKEKIKITASSSQVDYSQDIAEIYQLSDKYSVKRNKESADYFIQKKKQNLPMPPLIKQSNRKKRVLLGIALIAALISWILFAIASRYKNEEFNTGKMTNPSVQTINFNLELIVVDDANEVCLSQDIKIVKGGVYNKIDINSHIISC